MFRIYHFYAVASAIVVVIAMLAVGFIYNYYAVRNLVEDAENYNVVLAKTLS